MGVLAILWSAVSFGAVDSNSGSSFSLPVPRSQLYLPQLEQKLERHQSQVEVSVSTWNPAQLTASTVVQDSSPFRSGGLAGFGLDYSDSSWALADGYLMPRVGANFSQHQRTGSVGLVGDSRFSVNETLNVYSLRAGFELRANPSDRGWQAVLGLFAMPSWLQAPPTAFNRRGYSDTAVMANARAQVGYMTGPVLGFSGLGILMGLDGRDDLRGRGLQGWGLAGSIRLGM